jgi:hypothetical protein
VATMDSCRDGGRMSFSKEYLSTWVEPSAQEASLFRRWNLYLVSIEIFDRSLPHHPSSFDPDQMCPDHPWGAAGTGYAFLLRGWLGLGGGGPPVGIESRRLRHADRLAWVVKEWVRAAEDAAAGRFGRLHDFGITTVDIEDDQRGKRCRFSRFGHPHPHTMPFALALSEMWTGHPDGCSHTLKIERDYSGCPRIGICLRCGCKCDPPERHAEPISVWDGQAVARRKLGPERAVVVAEPHSVGWPMYEYLPGSKDSWPVGQAPGEREAFAKVLSAMRRPSS